MSYTYNPGARPDALSILRDKGLLDTPPRLHPQPGTFVLCSDGHFQVGDDGVPRPVSARAPVQSNDALPALPLLNFRALGWALVTLMILAGLMGLLTIGAR